MCTFMISQFTIQLGFAVYIKINLLPQAFRPKKILIKFDYKFVLTLVIILGALGVGGYYYYMKRTLEETKTQITFYRGEEAKIRRAVELDKEVKELNKNIEERVNIIKELTGDSDVRFAMLEHINVALTGNLWLLNINEVEENNRITFNIEGMSYSKDDISDFIAGLEKFEKFSNVSLESIRPAPLEIRDAFNYIVKVELISSMPVVQEEEKIPARGRRRR